MVQFDAKCGDCLTTRELMTLYETATVVSNSIDLVASLEKALMSF